MYSWVTNKFFIIEKEKSSLSIQIVTLSLSWIGVLMNIMVFFLNIVLFENILNIIYFLKFYF